MDLHNINLVINEINSFIKQELWYDFMVKQYINNELSILGGVSLSYPDIEIKFKNIFFISLPMEWKSDTSINILSLLAGAEEAKINQKFQVDYPHYLFKFVPEGYPEQFSCLIAAKCIMYTILKPNN